MKIVYFVIYMNVFLLVYCQDHQEIRFNENDVKGKASNNRVFTFFVNDTVMLIFEGSTDGLLTCNKSDANKTHIDLPNNIFYKDFTHNTRNFNITPITYNMSTQWRCRMRNKVYLFEVRVKGAKKPKVKLDNFELDFTMSNRSVTAYDAFHEFTCEVGETIQLSCGHSYDGTARLAYYDARGTNIVSTTTQPRSNNQLTFIQLMRAENSGSYIDCTYLTPVDDYQQEFTRRIIFKVKNKAARNNIFIVTVNGAKLAPHMVNGEETYRYKSIYKLETVTVTCEYKDKTLPGRLRYKLSDGDSTPISLQDDDVHWKTTFQVNTSNSRVLYCYNSENKALNASINITVSLNHEPIIIGLPKNNIIYQYSVSDSEWRIAYQFKAYDMLHLTCLTQDYSRILTWIFEDKTRMELTNQEFKLNERHNTSNIICEAKRPKDITKKTIIVLHQESNLGPPEAFIHEGDVKYIVIIGVAVAVVAVVGVVCACFWCKRNKNKRTGMRAFKSFNDNNNPIPPFPRQWDTYDYAYPQNVYTTINTNNYVEINNSIYIGTPDYSLPHITNTNANHSAENQNTLDSNSSNVDNNTKPMYALPYEQHNVIKNKPTNTETYEKLKDSTANYSNLQKKEDNTINKKHEQNKSSPKTKKGKKVTFENKTEDNSNSYVNFQSVDNNISYSNLLETNNDNDK